MSADQPEPALFRVLAPVPVTLADGRPVVCGEEVTADPKANQSLINAGLLVAIEKSHHAPRRRPTTTKEQ